MKRSFALVGIIYIILVFVVKTLVVTYVDGSTLDLPSRDGREI